MNIDEMDLKILKENSGNDIISKLDIDNVNKIYKYLEDNNVYYVKDLFLSSLDLFCLPSNIFIKKFERLKLKLGDSFVEKLGDDSSYIEIMYEQ